MGIGYMKDKKREGFIWIIGLNMTPWGKLGYL